MVNEYLTFDPDTLIIGIAVRLYGGNAPNLSPDTASRIGWRNVQQVTPDSLLAIRQRLIDRKFSTRILKAEWDNLTNTQQLIYLCDAAHIGFLPLPRYQVQNIKDESEIPQMFHVLEAHQDNEGISTRTPKRKI